LYRAHWVLEDNPLAVALTLAFGFDAVIARRPAFVAFDAPFATSFTGVYVSNVALEVNMQE
jgi:hypothetical protein